MAKHGDPISEAAAARQHNFQASLSSRVHGSGGGIDQLSTAERRYFMLQRLVFQLREGGVFWFFNNSAGDHYSEVLSVLLELGLTRMADGLADTKALLFGDSAVPRDIDARRRLMPVNRQGEPKQKIRKALAEIDERTDNAVAEIEEKMEEIAHANQLY